MSIRKAIAGIALAGALTVGGATAAFAQTDPASPSFPKHPNVTCADAVHRVADMQARLDHIKVGVEQAKAKRDQLVANGHPDAAQKLTDLIQTAETRITTVQTRLTKIEQTVEARCGSADDGTASSSAAA